MCLHKHFVSVALHDLEDTLACSKPAALYAKKTQTDGLYGSYSHPTTQ